MMGSWLGKGSLNSSSISENSSVDLGRFRRFIKSDIEIGETHFKTLSSQQTLSLPLV